MRIVHVRMVQDHAEDVSSHERAQRGSDAQRVHDRRIQGVSACIHGACHKQQKVKHLEAKHQKTGQNGKPTFAEKRRQQKHACHNWEQNSVERKHVESTFGEELYQSNDKSRARQPAIRMRKDWLSPEWSKYPTSFHTKPSALTQKTGLPRSRKTADSS